MNPPAPRASRIAPVATARACAPAAGGCRAGKNLARREDAPATAAT